MKKLGKICIAFSFVLLILSGCGKKDTQRDTYRAVTEIDIVTQHREGLVRRHYNTPEKMRPVLIYLRLVRPYGKAIKIRDEETDVFLIAVSLSDGQKHYYRQAQHRYFSIGSGNWREIDPEAANKLYQIMREFPSDDSKGEIAS